VRPQTQGVGTTALTVALRPNGQVCVVGIPCRGRPVYPKPEAAVASHLIAAGIRPPIYLRRCQLDVWLHL
jgi:hypothetical protein